MKTKYKNYESLKDDLEKLYKEHLIWLAKDTKNRNKVDFLEWQEKNGLSLEIPKTDMEKKIIKANFWSSYSDGEEFTTYLKVPKNLDEDTVQELIYWERESMEMDDQAYTDDMLDSTLEKMNITHLENEEVWELEW